MRHPVYCILFVAILSYLLFTGCDSKPAGHQQGSQSGDTLAGRWYKHYTGTVAGKEVYVNLYYTDRSIRGTYYYADKGIPISLYGGEDTTPADLNLYLTEDAETDKEDGNDYTKNPHWLVTLSGDKITGKWISKDGRKTHDISLAERYAEGSYRFVVLYEVTDGGIGINTAVTSDEVSIPADGNAKADREFLDAVVRKDVGCNDNRDYTACLKAKHKEYIDTFIAEADTTDTDPGDSLSHHNEAMNYLWVMYNEHGWVVFESMSYTYLGGAHGLYGSTYICADVQEKKVWELKDIMNADTPKLMQLIEQEARHVFHIKPGDKLDSRLLTDTIPVTGNIYCTEKGIAFNYTPYEIASFADGQASLFIPFTKVMDMLTPAFRKRMKL